MSDPVLFLKSPRHWKGELIPSGRGEGALSRAAIEVEVSRFELWGLPAPFSAASPAGEEMDLDDREYSLVRVDFSIARPTPGAVTQIAALAMMTDENPSSSPPPPTILSVYPVPGLSPASAAAGLRLTPLLDLAPVPDTDRGSGIWTLTPRHSLSVSDASVDSTVGVRWTGVPLPDANWPLCQSFVVVTSAPRNALGYLMFDLLLEVEHAGETVAYSLPEKLGLQFHRMQSAQEASPPSPSYSMKETSRETTMRDIPADDSPMEEMRDSRSVSMDTGAGTDHALDRPRLFPVWFATNRRPAGWFRRDEYFTSDRDDKIHYGTCKVQIPKSHKIGSLGSSLLRRLLTATDDRLKVESLQELNEAIFWLSVSTALQDVAPDERMALLFIHGYNTSFKEAVLRAAQIGFDLKVPGVTALYSWPSKGSIKGYAADAAAIEASEPFIEEFLMSFARRDDIDRVHVIAHSMGNRALLRIVQRVAALAEQQTKTRFGQIFLAAPDIDRDAFMQLAGVYRAVAERTTLYASSKDKALAASGILHDYARAGFTPPITLVPGIDTVEVSEVDLTFLGHGYVASMRPVLQDMHNLILHDEPPQRRLGLERVASHEGEYWRFTE